MNDDLGTRKIRQERRQILNEFLRETWRYRAEEFIRYMFSKFQAIWHFLGRYWFSRSLKSIMAYQTTKKSNEPTRFDEQSAFAIIVQLVLDYLTDLKLMILIVTNVNVSSLVIICNRFFTTSILLNECFRSEGPDYRILLENCRNSS